MVKAHLQSFPNGHHTACIRFYKRFDDTVLLNDCPVGLRQLRVHYKKIAATVATLISFVQELFLAVYAGEVSSSSQETNDISKSVSSKHFRSDAIMGTYEEHKNVKQ